MRVLKRAALLGGLALAGIGGQASAATTVGETFAGGDVCGSLTSAGATLLQTASPGNQYRVNDTGVITSWSYQAGSAPFSRMQLKLASQPRAGSFVIEDESEIETPVANTLNTFQTRISIGPEFGFFLGFWETAPPEGANCWRTAPGYSFIGAAGNPPLNEDPRTWVPGYPNTQLNVSAVLEPDADNDEFGDESQDTCLPPTVQTDCDSPETTITKAPEKQTSKRKVRFKFTSDEPGSTFECRLNNKTFKPCESPFRKRVKAGRKHKFKVRATDGGGNVDPSPAKHKFRVVA